MKVLYFSSTPISISKGEGHLYNGCGWIGSLIENLSKRENIEIGISFFSRGRSVKKNKIGNIHLLPMRDPASSNIEVLTSLFINKEVIDNKKLEAIEYVVEDFKPDIIHIFGTEDVFGLVGEISQVPIVIHLQGIINPYINAFLPPSFSWHSYFKIGLTFKHKFLRLFDRKDWQYRAKREIRIFKTTKYFFGRTDWDERITKIYNHKAHYYTCWEILRKDFYHSPVKRALPSQPVIISTISNVGYKGFDMILKTAMILKEYIGDDFIWKVFGGVNNSYFENHLGIKAKDYNVELMGIASAETIRAELINSTVYFHPSYIDNSPNSVCEAMMMGCAIICCNVGGVSTLVNHGVTGFLVPSNDPYTASSYISSLIHNKELNLSIGSNAHEIAVERHNPDSIIKNVLDVYNKIINPKYDD